MRLSAKADAAAKADKAQRIHAILDRLYPQPPIPLRHDDPFTLLVAVALSAQTTDARVNLVTPALFERAPDAAAMAALEVEEILALIKTCGLAPAKSKNLRRMSELLVERHGGDVPKSFADLEALPGVGHKTASVVMSQAFGVPAFPVDTHIHRLAARWGLSDGHSVERTERDLKALFPEDAWNRLHLQIIYFGREYCPARGHEPGACPICSWAFVGEPAPAKARKSRGKKTAAKKKSATKRAKPTSKRTAAKKKAATKKAATKKAATTRKPAAKKPAKKTAATKTAAAKKAAAKKAAAKKTAAKKTAAKKTAAKKTAAKKTAAKKSEAKKSETKKPAAKRPTAKKSAAKKPAAKKTAAKKSVAKKPAAKKTAAKKSSAKKTAAA